MEKEEKILDTYIQGKQSGEDNKLRAAIGSLNAKRTKELSDSITVLKSTIDSSIHNLIISIHHQGDSLNRSLEQQVSNLNSCMAQQVDNLIESNMKLGASNEKYAYWMKWLTFGLLITSVAGVLIAWTGK